MARKSPADKATKKKKPDSIDWSILNRYISDLFVDEHGTPYAKIRVNGHFENWPLTSRYLENFITKTLWEQMNEVPNESQLKQCLKILSARAMSTGEHGVRTHLRVAMEGDSIYLDLCRPDWKVLKITPDNAEIVSDPLIVFRRYGHMKMLKIDMKAKLEDIELIWKYVPLEDEQDKLVYKVGLVLNLIPDIPRVINMFFGAQGSGKTAVQKKERALLDPSSLQILSLPTEIRELAQQTHHNYICFYDNVSKIRKNVSDFFCRVTTGEGISKRALYTDEEDVIWSIKRKLGFNGINLAGLSPDLLDRTVTYQLKRIPKTKRKIEKMLDEEFEQDQPKITGAIVKIIQKAMTIKPQVRELPRMADYAVGCEAVSRALGEKEGAFLHAYWQKIRELNKDALEAQPVGLAILELMKDKKEWEGSSSELLNELTGIAEKLKINTRSKFWPGDPTWLGRRINEVKTNLEDEGIKYAHERKGNKRIHKFSVISVIVGGHSESLGGRQESLVGLGVEKTETLPGNDTNNQLKNDLVSRRRVTKKTTKPPKTPKTSEVLHNCRLDMFAELCKSEISKNKLFEMESLKKYPEVEKEVAFISLKKEGMLFEPRPGRVKAV